MMHVPDPIARHPAGAEQGRGFSDAWIQWRERVDLNEYDRRWDDAEAAGQDVHGEADFIASLADGASLTERPVSILDAGCGTGRVGIELARRGHEVWGVDLDADLLDRARRRAPHLTWMNNDLSVLDLGRKFDIVAMAGNVLPFVRDDARHSAMVALAGHLTDGGLLVAGFSLPGTGRSDWPTEANYVAWCSQVDLAPVESWCSWDRSPVAADPTYRVFVHRK